MIFLLIKTNPASAHKNCTNPSFFIVEGSLHKPVVSVLSTRKVSKVIGLSCQNADNVSRRYKTLKDFQKHTRFFPLGNLFLGFDDSELDEEEEEDEIVQKKSKTAKRNRSAYLVGFLNTPDSSQFDEEKIQQKTTFNHFLNPFYLDVIIQLHSPPPDFSYLSA